MTLLLGSRVPGRRASPESHAVPPGAPPRTEILLCPPAEPGSRRRGACRDGTRGSRKGMATPHAPSLDAPLDQPIEGPLAPPSPTSPCLLPLAYVLPIRSARIEPPGELEELAAYLRQLQGWVAEVLVIDGSDPAPVGFHRVAFGGIELLTPMERTPMGKVGGVLTGVRPARQERIVIADDDVRYDRTQLERIATLLDEAEVVRPQNYFSPL